MPLISLVVPCYNEEEALPVFFSAVQNVVCEMQENIQPTPPQFEMILVDDGSTDGTLSVVQNLSERYADSFSVKWISFSRNFGKEAALLAGLQNARGDYVATLDADMQDPPSLLPNMYSSLTTSNEYDNVATYRVTRTGEPKIRSWFARLFYKIIHAISETTMKDGARDYRLMRRRMVDAIISLSEYNRFSKGIFGWVGFNTLWIPFENTERIAGKTKWSFWSLLLYSIEGMVAFSTKPLQIASISGILFCLLALILMVFVIARAALFGDPVAGWPSLVCVILLVGGMQLLCMGIFGHYLARTYLETKHRPIYIVRSSNIKGL